MTDVLAGSAAPVIPVTPAPGAQPVTAPEVPSSPDQATDSVKPQPRTFTEEEHRKAISDRLAKERRRLERTVRAEVERDLLKQQLESRDRPAAQAEQPKGEPQAKDFNEYDEYLLAKAEYRLEQKLAKQNETKQRESAQEQQQRSVRGLAEAIDAKFAAARDKHEDFDEVVRAPNVPFTEPMAAFFAESDIGGDLAYHLANNLDEAKRIAGLSPGGIFRELVKLESTLSAPPKPTQAPPPIVPSGGSAVVKKDWKDMTTTEHAKAYWARKK
jgi:hypothetical protein